MKRALLACVAVGFVVAAISIARGHTGQSQPFEAQAPSTTTTPADVSRPFDRELTTEQIKKQADQVLRAQEDIAKDVAELANDSAHSLIVTIREESPGDLWALGRSAGKPACVRPSQDVSASIKVTAGVDGSYVVTKLVPSKARLLKDGACQATLKLFVHPHDLYAITVEGAGGSTFDPVKVSNGDEPQKVTIVG